MVVQFKKFLKKKKKKKKWKKDLTPMNNYNNSLVSTGLIKYRNTVFLLKFC